MLSVDRLGYRSSALAVRPVTASSASAASWWSAPPRATSCGCR